MNNIIVTGGAGYIGSMTCKVLKQYGYNPIVVDNLQTGFKFLAKFGVFEMANIGDKLAMTNIFNKYKPISVIHFAANTSVGESVSSPFEYYYNNTINTINLLNTMLECGVNNIIFSSTAAVFGNPQSNIIKEDHSINPINPYGKSKAIIEDVLHDFDNAYGLKYIALRYFNVVGADPDLEIGECRIPGLNLFPLIFYRAMNKQDILIYGNDYNTKDGTCIRDYIHVKDLAIAHVLAMKKLFSNQKSTKINLGNGKGFSVKEIIETAQEVIKLNFKTKVVERRKGDPDSLISDISFSRKYLNWHPQFVKVKNSLEHAWAWFQKYTKQNNIS